MKLFGKDNWREKGMAAIQNHPGRRKVYGIYSRVNPVMAEKYLRFLARNRNVTYIMWDNKNHRFVA